VEWLFVLERHEGETCDAVLQFLEKRTGQARADIELPEKTGVGKPVEIVFMLGDQHYAMEQTLIEPFEGHMQLNAQAEAHFGPIVEALKGKLPEQFFELHIPIKAMIACKKQEIAGIQTAIASWVEQVGPGLPIKRVYDYIGDIAPTNIPGVPFPVTLYRFDGLMPRLQVVHQLVSETRAEDQLNRIARACENKFPKLADWKEKKNSRTILVLEDNDIQLTSITNVSDAFAQIVKNRNDIPDETYLVASCMDPWYAWPIYIDGLPYPALCRWGRGDGWEIDQKVLNKITAR
jgi:hypothetical protein